MTWETLSALYWHARRDEATGKDIAEWCDATAQWWASRPAHDELVCRQYWHLARLYAELGDAPARAIFAAWQGDQCLIDEDIRRRAGVLT